MSKESERAELKLIALNTMSDATNFINRLIELKKEILERFPISTFNMTSSQAKKAHSFENIYAHLVKQQHALNTLESKFNDEDRREAAKEKELKVQEIQREQIEYKTMLTQDAIIWLTKRGLELGKDFTLDEAIEYANSIAFDEAVAELRKSTDWIKFDGDDNCAETCRGWDGVSKRCECGNRRVSFDECYSTFKDPFVRACAY
jgi:hypothetical protein